jgi:UDP-N-acetylglucosamine pyrophosphorylase
MPRTRYFQGCQASLAAYTIKTMNNDATNVDSALREQAIRTALLADGASPMLMASFLDQVRRVAAGTSGLIPVASIDAVSDLPDLDCFGADESAAGQAALPGVVLIKLNGGLGTGMGLEKAKSLLPVKHGLTFLDIIARQVLHLRQTHNVPLPLLLMTSYSTDRDTLDALAAYPELAAGQPGLPLTFLQNRVPKLLADTLEPASATSCGDLAWCPPGHGDLYTALLNGGLLDRLVASGLRHAFLSNADNLGAVIDPAIPGYMLRHGIPFLMEVADRTAADRKGGHLARERSSGRLLLRESAQCPSDEQDDFQDTARHRYFNTNNLWIDLVALRDLVQATGAPPPLALIVNHKRLNPRDDTSPAVVQLETAMGSAIASFDGATALRVPRTRFAPVKTTDDLLALWSDAYELTPEYHIRLDPRRSTIGPPLIRLDPAYYKKIDDFSSRFPDGAPSLLYCRSLTVKGDHTFVSGQVFDGCVKIG